MAWLQRNFTNLFGKSGASNKRTDDDDEPRFRVSDFLERWGFEYSVSLVCQDTNLTEDEVYSWSVLRFFNKLSYLKDKGKFEIALNGNKR
jgi:hypothetical protein